MNIRRLGVICSFILLLYLIAGAQPALAHANLVRSEPPANSAQKTSPTRVRLWFSEDIEPSFTSARVLDGAGSQLDKRDGHRLPDDSKALELSLPELQPGLYTVAWNALSAADGHATSGSFAFTVGDVPPAESSPREIAALVDATLSAAEPPPLYQVLARWLNALALALLGGAFAFPWLVLFPALRAFQSGKFTQLPDATLARARVAFARQWARAVWILFALCAVATVGFLIMQALTAGGLSSIGPVLGSTRFGMLWWVRVALLAALGLLIWNARARWLTDGLLPDRPLALALALCLLLLVTQSLSSHAAAIDTPPFLALGVDFLHLLGTAIWLGGLVQLMLVVPALIRDMDAPQKTHALASVVARFSNVALLTFGVIIASGVYATIVEVGSIEGMLATLYGQSLLVKTALVVAVLAIAAFNLLVVRPGLAQSAVRRALVYTRYLRVSTLAEALVAVAILLVVGILTSAPPARSAYDPTPKLLLQTQRVDDLQVTLGVVPGLVGTNDFDVKVTDLAGQPVTNANVVRLLGTSLDMSMGTQEAVATPVSDGHYALHGDMLSMGGRWSVEVLIRRDGRDDARHAFELLASGQRTPEISVISLALQQPEVLFGLGLILAGFGVDAAGVLAANFKRWERLIGLAGGLGVSLIGAYMISQSPIVFSQTVSMPGSNLYVPDFARVMRSPVPATAENIAAGKEIYLNSCAVCHGPQGKGNGPLAATLNPRPVDLTVHARLHTEGELFYWITNGISGTAMPKWQDQLTDMQRWQVVDYVRTLPLVTPGAVAPPAVTATPAR
jgi:copper transport protein